MSLQKYNILIIDDDPTFGGSLKAALSRTGFRSHWIASPAEALRYVKLQEVHGLIIDCMLPKMNGIELHSKLKENLSTDTVTGLMSGIFKDKSFIRNSLLKTGAQQFFTKPFEVSQVVEFFREKLPDDDETQTDLAPLMQLYLTPPERPRQLVKILNGSEGLHNFDLPWVFKLIEHAKLTGHLNIACTNGDIAGVGFIQGQIVQVNIENEEPLLGLLLVDKGYLDRSDLDKGLALNKEGEKLGQTLVHHNFISPHAVDIVLKDQLIWRLKRLIADSQMELNLVLADEVHVLSRLNAFDMQTFYVETLESVIRDDWLKAHYLPLGKNVVGIKTEKETLVNSYRYTPFVARIFPFIQKSLVEGTTIEELFAKNIEHESAILKAIHFLNIMGCLNFTQVQKQENFEHQKTRLKKLASDLEHKNYFERLGLSRSAKDTDIKKAYHDLAKSLHPDKLPQEAPEDLVELNKVVFRLIQTSYETLKKPDLKDIYVKELKVGQAEQLVKADQVLEQAKTFLLKGQAVKAFPLLKETLKLNPESTEARILSIWCQIKGAKKVSSSLVSDIDKKLQKIPLKHRDVASYYHTKGLYFKMAGDKASAIKYFKTALARDNAYINSRRELTSLENSKEKKSIFQADFKDVVGMLFKKR